MKITIVCAGKIKEKYLREGVAEYEKRLRPYADLRTIEIGEERMKDKPSVAEKAETIRREGERQSGRRRRQAGNPRARESRVPGRGGTEVRGGEGGQ